MAGSESLSILDGSTFVVSDRRGDIEAHADQPHGLFFRDTRFLSRWVLSLDGQPLEALSTDDVEYFAAQFFLVRPTGTIYENPYLSVVRQRYVGDGFHEDLVLLNHAPKPVEVTARIEAGADFADLFEVKDALRKQGELYHHIREHELVLGYRRGEFVRETSIWASAEVEVAEDSLTFHVSLPPHGRWDTCIEVTPRAEQQMHVKYNPHTSLRPRPNMGESLEAWLAEAPLLETDWDDLRHIYRRSLVDLAALRFYPDGAPAGASVPAAGLPWFMALFGRDSLITSYQALPFAPELARTTLRVLAAGQGQRVDPFRDEEPGKILHELRVGELTHFGERPHSPYYGAADTTPLFLIVLEETERWTGDRDLVRELEPNARAALDWIDQYGDRDADGYVEYETRNPQTGLPNQCWKDSWNSILFADGSLAKLPRATCEIQGYVYDAKRRTARLAREVWDDPALAARLEREAAELKARFNRDFWLPERRAFALALDGDKRPVDSLTSNMGQLLWSGIVEDGQRAAGVVEHLLSERLFSGWGVRTMAEGEGAYNPIEYHNGTVWPHDNAFIAAGLRRYGYSREAARIARAILEAATYFEHRLPEVFAGYPRSLTMFPVEYPTASSPQAWATGTPLLLLRVVLGLEPSEDGLVSEPALPDGLTRLALRHVAWRGRRLDPAPPRPARLGEPLPLAGGR
jgi:glycogen debranching enzyme